MSARPYFGLIGRAILYDVLQRPDLTQAKVASVIGVHKNAVSRWVLGETRPSIEAAFGLWDHFAVPVRTWMKRFRPPSRGNHTMWCCPRCGLVAMVDCEAQ